MTKLSPLVATLLVVAGTLGTLPLVGVTAGQAATPTAGTGANATAPPDANATLAPGQQLAAVVGVQRAGIEGRVEVRAFGQRVAAAAGNTSKAGVVRAEIERLRERLERLRETRRELRAAHRNGSIDEGQYRARLASLHAQVRAVERQVSATRAVTRRLPAEALEARGVNATAIRTLRSDAADLTGPEVSGIARSIAGRAAARGVGPAGRGPPVSVANRSVPDERRGPPGNESGDRGGESG